MPEINMQAYHTPVLLEEAVTAMNLQPGNTVIDGTIGGGGHAAAILERIVVPDSPIGTQSAADASDKVITDHGNAAGLLIGFDQDQEAIDHVQDRFKTEIAQGHLQLIHANSLEIPHYARQLATNGSVHAVLLDLGISNRQIRHAGRGFTFLEPVAPLDMRMDQRQSVTAQHIVNTSSETELAQILWENGEESNSRRIAHAIIEQRAIKPLETIGDLLECIAIGYRGRSKPKHHMATRTFQALRIAVNAELQRLPDILSGAVEVLEPGGRLAVITFHSLEDRIVKHYMKQASIDCVCPPEIPECRCEHTATVKLITKKPIIPSPDELDHNPQARSAKLRVVEKISTTI